MSTPSESEKEQLINTLADLEIEELKRIAGLTDSKRLLNRVNVQNSTETVAKDLVRAAAGGGLFDALKEVYLSRHGGKPPARKETDAGGGEGLDRRSPIAKVAVLFTVVMIAGWAVLKHMEPLPGVGRTDFLNSLNPALIRDRHASILKSLDYKATPLGDLQLPVKEQYTFFSESQNQSVFIKLQIFKLDQFKGTGAACFRPYSTNSKGDHVPTSVWRTKIRAGTSAAEHDFEDFELLKSNTNKQAVKNVQDGDFVLVYSHYSGPLVENHHRNDNGSMSKAAWDWHQVEVSDFAVSEGGKYFFATGGSKTAKLSISSGHEVIMVGDEDRYVPHDISGQGVNAPQCPAVVFVLASKVLEWLKDKQNAPDFSDMQADALSNLTSEAAFKASKWAWDTADNQKRDVFYVTFRP